MQSAAASEDESSAKQTAQDLLGLLHKQDGPEQPIQAEQAKPIQAASKPIRRSISAKFKQHGQDDVPPSHQPLYAKVTTAAQTAWVSHPMLQAQSQGIRSQSDVAWKDPHQS